MALGPFPFGNAAIGLFPFGNVAFGLLERLRLLDIMGVEVTSGRNWAGN